MNDNNLKKLSELQQKYNDMISNFNNQKEQIENELYNIRTEMIDIAVKLLSKENMELKTPYDETKVLKNSTDFFNKYYVTEKEPDGRDGCFFKGYVRDFWDDINKYAEYLKKEGTQNE